MGANIRNGAPLDQRSLCETCRHAHIERGYRESEELVVCQLTFPGHRVSFRVRQCSGHTEAKGQTLKQMERIAWVLDAKGYTRKLGFVPAEERPESLDPAELIPTGSTGADSAG
jgi:hypothetical protein